MPILISTQPTSRHCLVLQILRHVELYANLVKCLFHEPQVEFCRYIISNEGILMDRKEVQTIID